jgi:hypothetical protein
MTFSIMADHCYAECHLGWLSLMLGATYKPFLYAHAEFRYTERSGGLKWCILKKIE